MPGWWRARKNVDLLWSWRRDRCHGVGGIEVLTIGLHGVRPMACVSHGRRRRQRTTLGARPQFGVSANGVHNIAGITWRTGYPCTQHVYVAQFRGVRLTMLRNYLPVTLHIRSGRIGA